MKSEREDVEARLRQRESAEEELRKLHADMERKHAFAQESLASLTAERGNLLQDKASLQTQFDNSQGTVAELQQKLTQVATELTNSARQLRQVQSDLKAATHRAEEAERIQKELQEEGVGLMQSLNEMRPKIVELTDVKVELGERIEGLERDLRSRDDVISHLETTLNELRQERERNDEEKLQLDAKLERELLTSSQSNAELQRAYEEAQTESEQLRASIRSLETDRQHSHQLASHHSDEIEKLTGVLQTHVEQASALRRELEEVKHAREEADEFLERARGEMEVLRSEIASKDEEIEHLREALPDASTPSGAHSLDDEMLYALKQQHSLEISAAQSHIRELETTIYETEAQVHSLQKHIAALEGQLARSSSGNSQHPPLPARTPARNIDRSDELRRASFHSHRSTQLPPASAVPSAFEGLSPETRHKRRVSLGMLKARIDSEVAASSNASRPSSRASPAQKSTGLPTVVEPASPTSPIHSHTPRRPQFLDEAHIFWCHSCQGDLVIL